MGLTRPRAAQIFDIDYKQATRVITVANITLTGGAPAVVDGVSLVLGDRVLVTGQTTASQNGLYDVTVVGVGSDGTWARTSDGNATGEILAGMIVMVTEGVVYHDTQWKLTTDNPIVIGTTALTFELNTSGNSISNGTSNISVLNNANVNVTVANVQIAAFASTGSYVTGLVSATGNVVGNYFIGNGSALTGISAGGSAITNGTSNVTVASGANTTVGVAGTTVATFASTGLILPGIVSVTGNITGGNLITGGGSGGNITGANVISANTVTATGNVSGGNLNVTGNIVDTGALFLITGSSANITLAPNGTNVIVATTTGANIAGTLNATGNGVIAGRDLTVGGTFNSYTTSGRGTVVINGTSDTLLEMIIGAGTSQGYLYHNATNMSLLNLRTGNLILGSNGTTWTVTNVGAFSGTGNITGGNIIGTTAVSATGNVQGGNLRTAGLISATGNITGGNVLGGANVNATTHTGTTVSVTGNITGGNLFISGSISDSAQLDINTTAGNANIVLTPNGTGNVNISANIMPTANATANIGSATLSFNTVFAKSTSAQYADLAEMYEADADYAPGTVLEFGGTKEVTISNTPFSPLIVGVVSTNPAYLMNSTAQGKYMAAIALVGRVPTQIIGPVSKGAMMVSAGGGRAKACAAPAMGTVIGKALQDHPSGPGMIEIIVGRL